MALKGVDLSVGRGVTALLGPNGAGKTTLISALTGDHSQGGSIILAGYDLSDRRERVKARQFVGYLPQRFNIAGHLTVGGTVRYAAWCNGTGPKRVDDAAMRALNVTELAGKAQDRVRTISGGERQRLGLACAIAHGPKVLLLDEPTVGLDPAQRVRFRRYLKSVSAECSVLLATHVLSDADVLSDQVVILSSGCVAFTGTCNELAERGNDQDPSETPLESGYRQVLEVAGCES